MWFESTGGGDRGWHEEELREHVYVLPLFQRLQDILGVKFAPRAKDKFVKQARIPLSPLAPTPSPGHVLYLLGQRLDDKDLVEIFAMVKHLHRISFEEGTALSLQVHTHTASLTAGLHFNRVPCVSCV